MIETNRRMGEYQAAWSPEAVALATPSLGAQGANARVSS